MSRAPSLASSGVQAGPASADNLRAFAGPVTITATRPTCFVSIAGILQPTTQAASWRMGRGGWFDDLSPSTASATLYDAATGSIGDTVLFMDDTGLRWKGTIDSITTSKQLGTGLYPSTISATDGLARLGLSEYTGITTSLSGYTLATLIPTVMYLIGMDPITVTEGDPTGTLPALVNTGGASVVIRGRTLLEYIQIAEKSSNAVMFYQPDGTFLAVTRAPIAGGSGASVDVLDLVGVNTPRAWTIETNKSSVINHWLLTDAADTDRLDASDADSIAAYGENAYSISEYMDDDADHWSTDLRNALSEPRPIVTNGEFPITSTGQAVRALAPLDWVSFDGDTWQVMSVEHSVSLGEWSMTITADVSQNYMGGAAEPTPEEPDPDLTVTTVGPETSTKSAVVVKTSSGTAMGNGAGDYLPCGYYAGFRHRPIIDFTGWSWPAGFVSVKKATLTLKTTGQEWVAFGSKPKFYVKRITESWSEGTYNAAPTSQYSTTNASVWPGPSRTTSGQVLKSCGRTEGATITVDVTDIMQDAHDAGAFHGLMLVAANEDSNANCIEFYSDDASSGNRPKLTILCYTT
jgi:hypothetical protein